MPQTPPVALVALDWGTSSCRAYALSANGELIGQRHRPLGILAVGTEAQTYREALVEIAGDWLGAATPVLACGMVGSARGWRDAGYREAPAPLADLVAAGATTTVAGPTGPVHLVPGVRTATGVMRGEETQLLGAALAGLQADPVVLPGTHSKWAVLQAGSLVDFHTAMTGELYALLLAHGTIAQVAGPPGDPDAEAFDGGARLGLHRSGEGVLSLAFEARSRVLVGALRPEQVRDFLSGLLVAAEISGALTWLPQTPERVTLVGDDDLCRRYQRVLGLVGIEAHRPAEDLTLAGLVHLARRLRLLPGTEAAGTGRGSE